MTAPIKQRVIDLEAIRGRHEHEADSVPCGALVELPAEKPVAETLLETAAQLHQLHLDRAALLAEVDRLRALCGRAAEELVYAGAADPGTELECFIAELRSAL